MREDAIELVRLHQQRAALEALPHPEADPGGFLKFAEVLKTNCDKDIFLRSLKKRLTIPASQRGFTRTHAAISCLQIDGIVTTNFDSGLKLARLRRFQLDPGLLAKPMDDACEVGLSASANGRIAGWLKSDGVYSWGGDTNAPLYLHGSLTSPGDVVFTASDYRKFYRSGTRSAPSAGALFLGQLAGNLTLLFIGYSFDDPFIKNVLATVAKRPFWQGEHFALVGVRKTAEDVDKQTIELKKLHITPIYYPISAPDHPEVQNVLNALEAYDLRLVDKMCEVMTVLPTKATFGPDAQTPASLVATSGSLDDQNIKEWEKLPAIDPRKRVERKAQCKTLIDLASDVRVRVIGIVGLGGTGKTTIVRQVFQEEEVAKGRYPDGVLVYPVRDDAQTDGVFDALHDKFLPPVQIEYENRPARVEHGRRILHSKRMLLVLDGVELLQGRPGQPDYGRFLSKDLQSLLVAHARGGQSLVVLTSRFRFVEFDGEHLGKSFRPVELAGLVEHESTTLLRNAGVVAEDDVLSAVHRSFEGHPLGLTLFAGAIAGTNQPGFAEGNPRKALELLQSQDKRSLDARLRTLLDWYRSALSPVQLAILSHLAVYPSSVSKSGLRALLHAGKVRVNGLKLTTGEGLEALKTLQTIGLVQFDVGMELYECHAIVRQEMRSVDQEAARLAISSLTADAPDGYVTTIDELQRVVDAVEVNIESLGEFPAASRLLISRLDSGQRFLDLGVPHIGLACLGRFVSETKEPDGRTRREVAEAKLGKYSVGTYVAWMREFHEMLGNLGEAERWRLLEGGRYIAWIPGDHTKRAMKFWKDGLAYAVCKADAEAYRNLRQEAWQQYGELLQRQLSDRTLLEEYAGSPQLALAYMELLSSDDPWFEFSAEIARQTFLFHDPELVLSAMSKVRYGFGAYQPNTYQTPSGTELLHGAPFVNDRESITEKSRIRDALYKANFLRMAKSGKRGDLLVEVLAHTYCESVAKGTYAQACLTVGDLYDQSRAYPKAAWARSWAAYGLCETGQARKAIELAERALDTCAEDLHERSRAICMRGCAHLALGEFSAALNDAEIAKDIDEKGGWPLYLANCLGLRCLASRKLGDARAAEWETQFVAYCRRVFRPDVYNRLPRFPLLPGEPGFQAAFPHLPWPEELLAAIPAPAEATAAIADGRFDDLLQRYRADVLKPWNEKLGPKTIRSQSDDLMATSKIAPTIVLDNESKERLLVGEVIAIVANAGQICREFSVSDYGIDMEIEFKDDKGGATAQKLYLQLKSGDSYLRPRKKDGVEVFQVKAGHVRYWMAQAFPVMLVIRSSTGEIRWMEVRDWLKRATDDGQKSITAIKFEGERFDEDSVRRWRGKVLQQKKC
ncbi:MAG TPA: DUF4365 domain-containing protein [Candidatus Angelobacter sp.]